MFRSKAISSVLLFLIIMTGTLSAGSFFNTYTSAYNVDLEDPDNYYTGTDDGVFDNTMGAGYTNRTLVAQVGFVDTTQPVNIEITFNNEDWMYRSASQPNLRRPFGLDVIVRQRWHRWNCTNSNNGETDETADIYHYGYQPGGDASSYISLTYDYRTDGRVTKKGSELPGNHRNVTCGWYDHDLIGAWIEFVLVLPDIDPGDSSYTVGSADDYYASFDINVTGGAVGSYHCEFTGYYEDPRDDEVHFTLNVVPTANASAINLDSSHGIEQGGAGLPIGRYFYSTTKDTSSIEQQYFAFCSSSEFPEEDKGRFTLVREGTAGGAGDSIEYEIGLRSNDYAKGDRWFSGDDVMADGGAAPETVFYSSRENDMTDIGGTSIHQRFDEGEILFRLAPGADVESLNAGVYSSYVYFHVVVNQ